MKKMNNETEFILSADLTRGFTVLANEVYDYLSDGAVGLYGRIIMRANIPGWKVYQSTLINDLNKKASVVNSMKELIEAGYIEKMQIRNEKGQIKGIKYVVHSKPIKKLSNVETVENTDVEPKAEKPISVKPISVKRPLINKDIKKERTLKKKDKTTTIEKNAKTNSSSLSEEVKNYKITLAIKGITKTNIKRKKLTVEQLELLEQYVLLQDNIDNLDSFSCYIAQEIKEGNITEKDLVAAKRVKKFKSKNIQSKLINRADIAEEYAAIEEEFLNIGSGTDYENEDLPS